MSAEIPRTRDTPLRMMRKLLDIAAILFGLKGFQERKKKLELNPARKQEMIYPNDRAQLYGVDGKVRSASLGISLPVCSMNKVL